MTDETVFNVEINFRLEPKSISWSNKKNLFTVFASEPIPFSALPYECQEDYLADKRVRTLIHYQLSSPSVSDYRIIFHRITKRKVSG